MDNLQQPLQPGTVLRFGSLEFMSHDGSYDMVLLPPQHDNNDGRRLVRRRRTRRRHLHVAEEVAEDCPSRTQRESIVNTQRAPTWRANCWRFGPGGPSTGPTSEF